MTTETDQNIDLQQANHRYLLAMLDVVRYDLEQHAKSTKGRKSSTERNKLVKQAEQVESEIPGGSTLNRLSRTFGLSDFERDVLLLCAGVEISSEISDMVAAINGDNQQSRATFDLAFKCLPNAHWSATIPASPLRGWRLLEVGSGSSLMLNPIRIDERILHHLSGVEYMDERLLGTLYSVPPHNYLVESHRKLAERIASVWSQPTTMSTIPVIQLCSDEIAVKRDVASAVCYLTQQYLYRAPAQALPSTPHDLDTLMTLWKREVALTDCALLLDCDDSDSSDPVRESIISRTIEEAGGWVIVTSRQRRRFSTQRPVLTFDIEKPTIQEQQEVWSATLSQSVDDLNGHVEGLVSQFNLNASAIQAASTDFIGRIASEENVSSEDDPLMLLWDSCRLQARPRLDDLAQRIEPASSWNDLVLPDHQLDVLHEIAAHVRQRFKVYEMWGFRSRSSRGLGISALFAGLSGTGKTMAAEVLADELRLDLYRIDLSSVVNKYIGETEKNLRQVFDAAEEGGSILLFDEADALFGKRSEVKDSHDRFANIEVSYLLQRMEAYRGLAILTTNLKDSLDTAFLRRLRFIVQFPFPDSQQRAEIWEKVYPEETPTDNLDVRKLAQLNMSGGAIRNVALNAAFIAADADEPVGMKHIMQAARSEYAKQDKPLTQMEIRGWL